MVNVCIEQAATPPSPEYLEEASGVSWFILVSKKQRRNSGVGV